jgi:hypothetical protein
MLGYGTGGLVLPQHLLERVYERTEVEPKHFGAHLHVEVQDLLHGLGLAESVGLWVEGKDDEGVGYRMTAVPFSNGLIIVNTRILFGRPEDSEFGFRLSIPSGQFHDSFINAGRLLDSVPATEAHPALQSILVAAGVTYFNVMTLSDAQADYYHSFQVLKNEFGDHLLACLATQYYAPRFPHEPNYVAELTHRGAKSVDRLRAMLKSGWLKRPRSLPVCCLMQSDFS